MADYIYLLENRLSPAQRDALLKVREVVRAKGMTVFLVGGAVRDLTSGSPVRDLDVVIQGNALKLRKDLEKLGAVVSGETEPGQALFLRFAGGVRMEFGSTLAATYPKPGKAVFKPATILEDLRRRDFTANAMALSLNDGSYGLLMDPMNGVADIEQRQLRLVSNYGFIEEPARLIRAARFQARLGWQLDEKTQRRYDTSKEEDHIAALSGFQRGYETEEIVHEEDPIRVMKRLESEGWMAKLFPAWTVAMANIGELEKLRAAQTQLQLQGLHPDPSAAHFPLLTGKMNANDIAALKASFPRPGFVEEIEALEAEAKDFSAQFTGRATTLPSQAWKLLQTARPEAILWTAYSSKSAVVQGKLKSFYTEWPELRQRIPYLQMQEMRIMPDLAGYDELLEALFYEMLDGKLTTPEEMKAFLEPYSPPAPPPPVNLRRARSGKKEAKPKGRGKKVAAVDDNDDAENEAAEDGSEDVESGDSAAAMADADKDLNADDDEIEMDLSDEDDDGVDDDEDESDESEDEDGEAAPARSKTSVTAKKAKADGSTAPARGGVAKTTQASSIASASLPKVKEIVKASPKSTPDQAEESTRTSKPEVAKAGAAKGESVKGSAAKTPVAVSAKQGLTARITAPAAEASTASSKKVVSKGSAGQGAKIAESATGKAPKASAGEKASVKSEESKTLGGKAAAKPLAKATDTLKAGQKTSGKASTTPVATSAAKGKTSAPAKGAKNRST